MSEWKIRLNEINLHSLLKDLLRNFWIPFALAVSLWCIVSVYGKLTYAPTYTSEATFVISAKGSASAYSSLSLTTNMAGVFSEVFEGNMLREKVEQKLDFEKQDWYIVTHTVTQTNLMLVRVISSSPEQSFLALNAVIDTYPELAQDMFANAVLDVIRDPRVPLAPSNSMSTASVQKPAALAGFALGIVAILGLSAFRDTVQTTHAAKRKLDSRFLGAVRHEEKNKTMRAKRKKKNIAPLISHPFVSAGFREDYQNLCSKLEYHMRKRGQKIILVSSAGENEGKSTVAANLALSLAVRSKRVALIDCDFRKPALHKIFSVEADEEHDFGRYLARTDSKAEILYNLEKHGIFLAVNATRHKYAQRLITSRRMSGFISRLRREMDYVILDTPPMMVAADTEALAAHADVALLVVREDWMYARNVNDCLDSLRHATKDLSGYVLNNCREKQKLF